jgi:hypothetical protein
MTVELSWLVPDRVVYMYGYGVNQLEDLTRIDRETNAYMDQSSAPLVHAFIDLRQLQKMPSLAAQNKIWTYPKHARAGWQVFIGLDDPIQRMIMSVLVSLFKVRFRRFSTPEEGLAFLQYVDSTLPDLKQYQAKLHTDAAPTK